MIDFASVFSSVLLFVALLIPGWVLGRNARISDEAIRGITAIVSDVAMPFLVFVKLAQTDFFAISVTDIVCGLLFPTILLLGQYALSGVFYPKDDVSGRGASTFTNCGFLSLPLAAVLFPDAPAVVGITSLFNLVHTFLILTLGVALFSGDRRHVSVRGILLKPVTFAIVLGFACSFLQVRDFFPQAVEYADLLASLCTPLSMLVLGVELSKFPLSKVFSPRIIAKPVLFKLILAPFFAILLCFVAKTVLPISEELSVAMFLSAGASAASMTVAFARTYDRDAERSAILALSSTVLCVLTLPLMSVIFTLFH